MAWASRAITTKQVARNALTIQGLADNLVPVTLGNIIGGTLLVAGVYWFAYLRAEKRSNQEE